MKGGYVKILTLTKFILAINTVGEMGTTIHYMSAVKH